MGWVCAGEMAKAAGRALLLVILLVVLVPASAFLHGVGLRPQRSALAARRCVLSAPCFRALVSPNIFYNTATMCLTAPPLPKLLPNVLIIPRTPAEESWRDAHSMGCAWQRLM